MRLPRILTAVFLGTLAWAGLARSLVAETRVFTDSLGRTLKGELVRVSGESVTIRREDGEMFTLRADSFCPADMKYFQEHGQKAGGNDAAAAPAGGDLGNLSGIVVDALVDGPSELHVTPDGVYWINGRNAKPGVEKGKENPTYINGNPWKPVWGEPSKPRGKDRSEVHLFNSRRSLDLNRLEFTLISVTVNRGDQGIEKRDKIAVKHLEKEISISIPDSQPGARWYKFSLAPP